MRSTLAVAVCVAFASLIQTDAALHGARAETYPLRSITMIVPYPAGGPTDTIARVMADPLKAALGQSIVIENVTGAGGSIGVGRAVRAPADGYTLEIGTSTTNVLLGGLYALQFDLLADLAPIMQIASEPLMIVGKKNLPANNLKELIAWLKANPDKATAATVGAAGGAQVSAVYFQKETGTTFRFVPYRGGGPAVQDMVAGRVDLMFDQAANALGPVRAGTVKAYAVMSKARWSALPDVPSIDESGTPGLYVSYWHGLWAPKGTPKEIVGKLSAAAMHALADPGVKKRLSDVGHDVMPRDQQSPEALAAYHKAEIAKWWPIIRASGLKAQ